jgi:hypothetical protein
MGRQFLEFMQTQDLPWQASPDLPGLEEKWLSGEAGGISTRLLRVPAGWIGRIAGSLAAEIFVLAGAIVADATTITLHGYAYFPEVTDVRSDEGATLLAYFDPPARNNDPRIIIDSVAQPWDRADLESEIAHLNYARKNLRLSPDGDRRTYLLGGLPHGHPADGARLERHPHAEEMFMVAGDMPCSLGVMTAGAYFYRPRSPGSNATISEWSDALLPVLLDPPYCPELPAGHPSLLAAPRRPTVDY